MKVFVVAQFAIWTGIISSVYFFHTLHNEVNELEEVKRRKVILFGNSFWGDWEVGLGLEPFDRLGCEVQNCEITEDITRVRTADAVVYHVHQLDGQPPRDTHRPHHQRWVFFMLESPGWSTNMNYLNWNGLFNWTMTYRVDSDVQLFHGRVQPKKISERHVVKKNWQAVVKRRRPVAWIVSNCRTQSNREEYVRRLRRWIDVDVYGRCGNLTCAKQWTDSDEDCLSMINNKYNFYLAFENTFCKDYVTEKFFKMLHLDVITVVRGGASYEKFSPMHSWFINTKDFASPENLAMHLKRLIAQPKQYAEFMKNKQNYDFQATFGIRNLTGWCELCAKLNDPNEPTKVYNELGKWWGPSDCHQPRDM